MDTESMLREIINYINNDRLNYALLINGQWGTGKTFFIKNKLFPLLLSDIPSEKCIQPLKSIFFSKKNKEEKLSKKPIYISLYGIESVDDISIQIYLQLSGKLSKLLSLGTGLIKAFKTDINFSEILSTLNNHTTLENYVLVFDDLERINMDINKCLSYINSFVEHQNIKTIIIANENELEKVYFDNNYELKMISSMFDNIDYEDKTEKDVYGREKNNDRPSLSTIKNRIGRIYRENYQYKKIKEKLIGETINYFPNINEIVDTLIDEYSEKEEYKFFLKENKETLLSNLNIYNCMNLRIVKNILEGFYPLFKCINSLPIKMKQVVLNKVYSNYIFYMINIMNGKDRLVWSSDKEYNEIATFENNDRFEICKYFVAFKFVDKYIYEKKILKEEIERVIKDYIEASEDDYLDLSLSYNTLKEYWLLEDENITDLLNELAKEIDDEKYHIKIFPKIILTLSYIENLHYETKKINEIIDKMKTKICEKKFKFDYFDLQAHFVNNKQVLEIYNKHISDIEIGIVERQEEKYLNDIDYIFEGEDWGVNLYNFVSDNMNNNKILNDKAFISKLNIDKLIKLIDKSNSKNLYYFKYTLDHIYGFSNLKDFYKQDKESVDNLISRIDKLDSSNYGVTKKEAMIYLKEKLIQVSKLLE